MSKNYILNLETNKIELHFEKSEYITLTAGQKAELKSSYLWSRTANAWVSRSINNHYSAIQTAKKLGFTEEERTGQRLSYEEQLERKAEKAEHRAERYEQYANNAERRAEGLQKELNSLHGDIAFFTQPIIAGHAGSQAFAKRRQRIYDRYHKGFEEYRKSEYFQERAETAQRTADKAQLKNPIYLNNRIEECNKNIRQLEKNIIRYEEILYNKSNNIPVSSFYEQKSITEIEGYLNDTLEKTEWEMDKLAFMENCMDQVRETLEQHGRKMYTKADLKPGYLFKSYRFKTWAKIERVNTKTVTAVYIEHPLTGLDASCPYAEIAEIKIPEDWEDQQKQKELFENPFKVGDIVCKHRPADNSIFQAFQVVKTTSKTATIQQIKVTKGMPQANEFISDKQERKTAKQNRQGTWVLNDSDWYLYKYTFQAAK